MERLFAIGVTRYISRISDGDLVYIGPDVAKLISEPVREPLAISAMSEMEGAQAAVDRHARNRTDYLTLSNELADHGVETWVVDVREKTITFSDMTGSAMLEERIPSE